MRSKTKRILAFLCAVVLVATTVLGNWYTKEAEAATDVTPVFPEGYENVTIKDFEGLEPGTLDAGGGYQSYPAKEFDSFDNVLLSMKVTFGGGSWSTKMEIAGTGSWEGLQLQPSNAQGDQLYIISSAKDASNHYGTTDQSQSFGITPAEAGVNKFVGEEFLLQLAFDFGETDSSTNKADLKLDVYINGNLAKSHTFTGCNMAKFGNYLNFYSASSGSAITYENVEAPTVIEPVWLDGYENITIQDFKDADDTSVALTPGTGTSTGYKRYIAADYTSFDNVLLSMKVKFAGGTYATRLDIAGGSEFAGWYSGLWVFPSDATGTTLKVQSCPTDANGFYGMTDGYQLFEITPTEAGVEKFVGEEFILQLAFDFGEEVNGKADLTLGVYINGKLAKSHTFTGCNTAKFGSYLNFNNGVNITCDNVNAPTEPDTPDTPAGPVELDGYTNLTIKDFKDADTSAELTPGTGTSTGYARYNTTACDSFEKVLFSMKVNFAGGTYATRLDVAGGSEFAGWYSGIWIFPSDATGTTLKVQSCPTDGNGFYGTTDGYQSFEITPAEAGISKFVNEEFILQLAFDFGEEVSGKADLTLGVYINGKLAKSHTFTDCNMSKFGNYLNFVNGANITYDNVILSTTPDVPNPPVGTGEPVELDGYDNITIKNFAGLTPGTLEAGGGYKYYPSMTHDSFDNVVLSMKVTFGGGSWSTKMEVAGTGSWEGLQIQPSNAAGDELYIISAKEDSNGHYGTTDETQSFAITPTEAGVNKFVGEEMILQLAFDFGEEVSGKADLTLDVYINGKLAKSHTFTGCNMAKFGSYLNIYSAEGVGSSITYGDVVLSNTPEVPTVPDTPEGPVILDGFRNLTISDFVGNSSETQGTVLTEGRYAAPDYYGYDVEGVVNFDRKLLTLNVTFEAGGWQNSIMFAGNGQWVGFNLYPSTDGSQLFVSKTWGSTITSSSTPILSAQVAGVDSFVGEEFLLQMSFEYGQEIDGKADLKLGIYINGRLYNNQVFTIAGCNINTIGDRLALYSQTEGEAIIIGKEVDMPKDDHYEEETLYQKITFDSFGIADGKYPYVSGKTAVSGTAIGRETLNKTVICGDILYEGSDNSQIIWGGTSAMNGLRMNPKSDGTMQLTWYDGNNKTPIATLDSEIAGVAFVGEKYSIRLSSELVDADKDGKVNDIKIGISFNGLLYNKEYFYVTDMGDKYGSYFSVYCAEKTDAVTLNSAPELVSEKPNSDFERVTFQYFGLADGTYECDGTDQSTFSGKGVETLDRKVLCGDILIDGAGGVSLMLGGDSMIWYGLRFITQADGSILLIWVDEDGTPFIETFNSAMAGTTLIGEWMNLMISTEIVDADGDGAKDDIEFGFWFNGVLYADKYYTVIDKASRLGKYFGFDCADEGTSISVRSIPEYVKGFDYSVYGLTEDWEKTLLDTGFKVYKEVGGSKDPEPFTGDWTEIGKVVCFFGTAMIVAIGACVCVVLQRRKNDRG